MRDKQMRYKWVFERKCVYCPEKCEEYERNPRLEGCTLFHPPFKKLAELDKRLAEIDERSEKRRLNDG